MSFDSPSFWIIFLVALVIYRILSRKFQNKFLLALSLIFYGAWGLKFLIILLISSAIDFVIALKMEKQSENKIRKWLLLVSVISNIGTLFFFKYYLYLANEVGWGEEFFPKLAWIYKWGLPIGISFYTFQILSYTIDVYRRKVTACRSFYDFVLFVTFFPQLVAGPIEKARHLLPQIFEREEASAQDIEQGLYLCLWGYFKKVFVANSLSYPIASYLSQSSPTEATAVLLTGLVMTIMVYADFSGYSDMARGMARCLGFKLVMNFRPFWFAKNPSDFWERWNVSLMHWIRDYLVLSIRNKQAAEWIESLKIVAVMTLVGVWHAPKINWLFFGLYNGLIIVTYLFFSKRKIFVKQVGYLLLLAIIIGSGLLHALPDLKAISQAMLSLTNWSSFSASFDLLRYAVFFVLPMIIIESTGAFHTLNRKNYIESTVFKIGFITLCCVGIFLLERSAPTGFIYFQF